MILSIFLFEYKIILKLIVDLEIQLYKYLYSMTILLRKHMNTIFNKIIYIFILQQNILPFLSLHIFKNTKIQQ